MHRVVFLDHLGTGATVLGDLVDIRPFKQAEADVAMAQAVRRPPVAVAIEFEVKFVQNAVELLLVIGGKTLSVGEGSFRSMSRWKDRTAPVALLQ